MLSDAPLTKRQLGWIIMGLGLAVIAVSLGVDLVHAGQFSGFGSAQQRLAGLGLVIAVFGATLIPLGSRPA